MRIPQVSAPGAPKHVLEPLKEWIAECVEAGAAFAPDEEFDSGFIRFRIEKHGGRLRVVAPTIGKPVLFVIQDCTDALRLIATQRAILNRFGLEASPCNCRQRTFMVRDLDTCRSLFIERLAGELGDESGWFIGAHDTRLDVSDPQNVKSASLWDVLGKRPEIGPYLLLPANWQVSFHGHKPVVMRGREPVEPARKSGSSGMRG